MAQGLAGGAALDQQLAGLAAFPEVAGVVADARQRTLGYGLGGFLRRRRTRSRAELEDAEQLRTDLLVGLALAFLRVVGHQLGDEEAGAQRRGLLVAHRVEAAGEVQALAELDIAVEVQLRVDRDHRRIAVGLDQLQHFEGVLAGGARRVVVQVETGHAPHLQHGGRRDHVVVAGVAGEGAVGVEGIVDAHDLAPVANHRGIHRVPGVDATVLASDHGADFFNQFLISQVRLLDVCWTRPRAALSGWIRCWNWKPPGRPVSRRRRAAAGCCR
ncbi:hypothetical protein D3C76_637780 [compost metagenome]